MVASHYNHRACEANLVKTGITLVVLMATVIAGCTTTPKVAPGVTALLKDMDELQATQVLHRLLPPRNFNEHPTRTFITGHIGLGLCKASQFSLNEETWPDLQVTRDEISFNAVKSGVLLKSTPHGKIPSGAGVSTINQYARISYREHLRFDKIESATVYEPNVLRTVCGRQKGQSEVIVHESATRWYAILIPAGEKDRFMAAMIRLSPEVSIKTEVKGNF